MESIHLEKAEERALILGRHLVPVSLTDMTGIHSKPPSSGVVTPLMKCATVNFDAHYAFHLVTVKKDLGLVSFGNNKQYMYNPLFQQVLNG